LFLIKASTINQPAGVNLFVLFSTCPGKTLYLEVLGIAGQPDNIWEDFTTEVADEWLKIDPDGRKPVPHWAKQWSYIPDIIPHIQSVSNHIGHFII
jgi:hypothetical protein